MSTSPFDIHPDRAATLYAIRDRHIGTAVTTQRQRLLDALKTLGHVTTFEAMRYLDIFDPRPRKLELVRDGHTIITLRRTAETEAGIKHRIGVYVMARGAPGGVPDQPAANDPTKRKAPGAQRTPRADKKANLDCAAQADFTPEAAASALQIGLEAANRALLMLGGGNAHASLIAATEALKALGAAADSLKVLIGL